MVEAGTTESEWTVHWAKIQYVLLSDTRSASSASLVSSFSYPAEVLMPPTWQETQELTKHIYTMEGNKTVPGFVSIFFECPKKKSVILVINKPVSSWGLPVLLALFPFSQGFSKTTWGPWKRRDSSEYLALQVPPGSHKRENEKFI